MMKLIKRCEDCNEELNMWHPDAICKLNKEIRDLRASIRERELCMETLGWAIGQVIPSFRATGTLTEHAAQTGAELVVTVNKLRTCVYAADALAQEVNNLNEGADESVADYELAAYCEARALVTR